LEKLFSGRDDILVYTPKSSTAYAQSDDLFEHALDKPGVISSTQRYPGSDELQGNFPFSEWPNVLRHVVENQETLRKDTDDYGISYETIRDVIRAAR
jgi:hypothetical protein